MTGFLTVFDAQTLSLGEDPWVTDGSGSGTFLLKDVRMQRNDNGGNPVFSSTGFAAVGSAKAVFPGILRTDSTDQVGLYVTDGTVAGTTLVKNVGIGTNKTYQAVTLSTGAVVFQLAGNNFTAGVAATTDIWVSDGTAAGTVLLKTIGYTGTGHADGLTSIGNGRAVFTVNATQNSAGTASEFWVTDGTVAGTSILKTFGSASGGSAPTVITPLGNGKAVYTARDNSGFYAIFTTDGTAAGTTQISSVALDSQSIAALGNGKAVFSAQIRSNNNSGLYVTDGTAAGTLLVAPAPSLVFGSKFTSLGNGTVVFSQYGKVMITDGTSAGTRLVKDLSSITQGATGPTEFTPLGGGKFVFQAYTTAAGAEPWVSDGTTAGTVQIKDLFAGFGGSTPTNIYPTGDGRALFSAGSSLGGPELFITDGTAAGTVLVKDIEPGVAGSYPSRFLNLAASTPAAFPYAIAPLSAVKPDDTAGTTPYTFTVTRTDASVAASVTFNVVGSGGSPVPANMIANPVGTVSFAAGASTATLTINVYGADLATTETFDVTLSGAPAGTAAATATGTVQANLSTTPDPLFDAAFYLARNPDVAAARIDPYLHFLLNGYKEGRDPSALFNVSYYLARNSVPAGVNPLKHFETVGYAQGRDPSAGFSVSDYLAANPDVKAAGINALQHYTTSGKAEGRAAFAVGVPDAGVDAAYYYAANPDVRMAGVDAATHYHASGWREGRNPGALFDTNFYLTQNPDVKAAGVDPLAHFEAVGWKEGREPSLLFSDAGYLAANPDVRAAGLDPLLHYITNGKAEGRALALPGGAAAADPLVNAAYYDRQLGATLIPTGIAASQQAAASYDATGWQRGLNPDAFFDTNYYLSHNPDVAAAHINPLLHYETFGWKEGRDASATFSTTKYLAAYGDVRAAGVNPLLHYIQNGQAEGRSAFGA